MVGQGHANKSLDPLRKVNMLGECGNNLSSTEFVQYRIARAFKKVGESLAVLAVANTLSAISGGLT
jgi:predicted adenine nucleotide alpha hydrolase (AANH) superfamily ATPase